MDEDTALRHARAVDEVDDAVQRCPEVVSIIVFISTGNVAVHQILFKKIFGLDGHVQDMRDASFT